MSLVWYFRRRHGHKLGVKEFSEKIKCRPFDNSDLVYRALHSTTNDTFTHVLLQNTLTYILLKFNVGLKMVNTWLRCNYCMCASRTFTSQSSWDSRLFCYWIRLFVIGIHHPLYDTSRDTCSYQVSTLSLKLSSWSTLNQAPESSSFLETSLFNL